VTFPLYLTLEQLSQPVSPYANNFEELSTEGIAGVSFHGVTAETTIAGMGMVNWHV